MKILLFGDSHFCEKSSIINKFGSKYSLRLENQLKTFSWIKEQAIINKCDMVIGLGDLFNTENLSDMEITAAKDLEFANIPTYLIVGNHESSLNDLAFNSTKILEAENRFIVSSPKVLELENCDLCLLPYILESDRKSLEEYFGAKTKNRIILSHNDIKGINYGPVESKTGFDLEDIKRNCNLFINAHIHNGQKIENNIINIGNLTGQNFGEDASKYTHNIIILDTDNNSLEYIENPFAFNFYKLEISNKADLCKIKNLKNQAVISVKCQVTLLEDVRIAIEENKDKIIESRVITIRNTSTTEESEADISELTVDHLAKFVECCLNNIDNSKILEEELAEICK